MKRFLFLLFGVVSYVLFLGVFLYAIAFLGNLAPRSIDRGPNVPLPEALLVNTGLLLLFALQHSVMARPAFKRWLTKFVPAPIERSFYVLMSSLALLLLFLQWRPMAGTVWDVQTPAVRGAIYALFACGWLVVLISTFLINHFDLFGLRQVWLYFRGVEYVPLRFGTPGPYRLVRHPLYVGWLLTFWAAPTMSFAHLLFALGTTAYILIAILFEERDLLTFHGPDYAQYRAQVPMLIPRLRRRGLAVEPAATADRIA